MATVKRSSRRRVSSFDWLETVEVDGPFLAAPVIQDTWPDGLPALDQAQLTILRTANAALDANIGSRDSFLLVVLRDLLGWRTRLVSGPESAALSVSVPEHHATVNIDFALLDSDEASRDPVLLGSVAGPGASAENSRRAQRDSWPASPAERLAHALRVRGVPLGLITDGTVWTLVSAVAGGSTSTATWTRHVWLEEPQTLRAFVALLERRRFFGVPETETLPALLQASLERQEEVTERLSEQSQAAVEMLVATIGRLESEHRAKVGRPLLQDVTAREVYEAGVTLLMRLIFLLYAEERALLPADSDVYARSYAMSTTANDLRRRAVEHGEDSLERTTTAWHRLLAASRVVHRGIRHEELLVPAYGGSLCDPDRFPWLEGRTAATDSLAGRQVLAIDDRTMLRTLEALQYLTFAGRQGTERRRVSYRVLDVEQIGYVYEGLLDQTAKNADDWVVSIAASERDLRRNGPEVALCELEQQAAEGEDALVDWLVRTVKASGGTRSPASFRRSLKPFEDEGERTTQLRLVLEACGNDTEVARRLLPFARILRLDPRDLPVVYPPGSLYLTDSDERAHTGAVYTPRVLAEEVVEKALEPQLYEPGPLETGDTSQWRLASSDRILSLRVIDMAVGSGAFLVAATRYLADRLMEARRLEAHAVGTSNGGDIPETPSDDQLVVDARRAIIDRCIYGVDINPMALEMAKLSLWLVSMDRSRPFSFLDDRLAVGDSLLGATRFAQIEALHLDVSEGRRLRREAAQRARGTESMLAFDPKAMLDRAAGLRRGISLIALHDYRDANQKSRLLEEARNVTATVRLFADALTAASLRGGGDIEYRRVGELVRRTGGGDQAGRAELERYAAQAVDALGDRPRVPAHFPILFPEVFTSEGRPGFDAVVGNPPFLGGGQISGAYGRDYREHLALIVSRGARARRPDLVAFFFLQAQNIVSRRGTIGLLSTNTLGQGDTRQIGLDQITETSMIYRANRRKKWPTRAASLHYVAVWIAGQDRTVQTSTLDGRAVARITTTLDAGGRTEGVPRRLETLRGVAFQGSLTHGSGFILSPDEAAAMIADDPRNEKVVRPYLTGEDLNQSPEQAPSRYIVDFGTMDADDAASYELPWAHVESTVRKERAELRDKPEYARIVENWWQYWAPRRDLYAKLADVGEAACITLRSNALAAVRLTPGPVFSHGLGLLCGPAHALFALLASSAHFAWAMRWGSTQEAGLRYALTDLYETFVQPANVLQLGDVGERLNNARHEICIARDVGLTPLYNLVHSPTESSDDIDALRAIHQEVDNAVLTAYGWEGLIEANDFVETDVGSRWSVPEVLRVELVDRLLELNHGAEDSGAAIATESPVGDGSITDGFHE